MHEFFLPIVLWGNYILFQEINSSLSLSILELSLNSFASLSIVSILVSYLCYFALFDTTFIFVAGYLLLKFPSKHDLVNCDSVSPCKSKFQHKHSFVNENVNVKRRLNDTLFRLRRMFYPTKTKQIPGEFQEKNWNGHCPLMSLWWQRRLVLSIYFVGAKILYNIIT